MSAAVVTALKARFPQATDRASADHPAVNLPLGDLVAALGFLRDEWAFDLLMDVTAIDWAGERAAIYGRVSPAPTTRTGTSASPRLCRTQRSPPLRARDLWPGATGTNASATTCLGSSFRGIRTCGAF